MIEPTQQIEAAPAERSPRARHIFGRRLVHLRSSEQQAWGRVDDSGTVAERTVFSLERLHAKHQGTSHRLVAGAHSWWLYAKQRLDSGRPVEPVNGDLANDPPATPETDSPANDQRDLLADARGINLGFCSLAHIKTQRSEGWGTHEEDVVSSVIVSFEKLIEYERVAAWRLIVGKHSIWIIW